MTDILTDLEAAAADEIVAQRELLRLCRAERDELAAKWSVLVGERRVFLGWSHSALRVLETLEAEDHEDGGELIRGLCESGRRLVHAALRDYLKDDQ